MEKETMPKANDHTTPAAAGDSYRKTMQHNAAKKLRQGGTLDTKLVIALLEMDDD